MTRRPRHLVKSSPVFAAILAWSAVLLPYTPSAIAAVTFSPIKPPNCSTSANFPSYHFWVHGPSNNYELPRNPNCTGTCPTYINNLAHTRILVTNAWTNWISLFMQTDMDLETNYDWFCFRLGIYGDCLTGYIPANGLAPIEVLVTDPSGAYNPPGRFSFNSDWSIARWRGLALDGAKVCTSLSSQRSGWTNTMYPLSRHTGFLLGKNDVLYFSVSAPSGYHTAAALWTDSGTHDVDLYARCNSLPSPTVYDHASRSADSMEFIDHPTCTGTLYFAAHAFSGSGAFNIVPTYHLPSGHKTVKVSGCQVFNPDRRSQWTPELVDAAGLLFGATEGALIIDKWQLWNANGCAQNACGGANCDLVFKDVPGSGQSPVCQPGPLGYPWVSAQSTSYDRTRTIAHELLHRYYCLQDEYQWPFTLQDGHAMMANHYLSDQNNICSDLDHNTDPSPGASPSSWPNGDALACQSGVCGGVVPGATDDNHAYSGFDFKNTAGIVEWQN